MKRNLKTICVFIVAALIIAAVLFLRTNYVVPILMYHSIDEVSGAGKLKVRPGSFERQMKFLQRHKYNIITLEKLVNTIKEKKPFPSKSVAITFDDGYDDNYFCAFPILKKYNVPVTIFVVVNNIGKKGYINLNQINEMLNSGLVSIGSHTMTHAYLPLVTGEERLKREIFQSKKTLEAMTNQKNIFFSYPVGGFNEKIRRLVKEANYPGACATNPGRRYPKDDIYALKRLRISKTSDNLFVFWIESSGYYTLIKEIRDED